MKLRQSASQNRISAGGEEVGVRPDQSQVGLRLHNISIRPQQDRSTALFTLAAELPAAIPARMLGVHIQVAVQWQKASGGDWAAYADDVSRRDTTHQPARK